MVSYPTKVYLSYIETRMDPLLLIAERFHRKKDFESVSSLTVISYLLSSSILSPANYLTDAKNIVCFPVGAFFVRRNKKICALLLLQKIRRVKNQEAVPRCSSSDA